MATTTETQLTHELGDQCVQLREIGWRGYLTMLKYRGERRSPRMVYLDGDLFLMSPSFSHGRLADRLGDFAKAVAVGLDIPCVPARATTLRRQKKRAGVEGDQTFYFANEALVRGRVDIDLRTDPPPDLAIEAVYTHGAEAAIEAYRRFRVPEVWIRDASALRIFLLGANRRYAESPTSASLPFLSAKEIFTWVQRPQTVSETEWLKDLHRWVRETLIPRYRR